MAPGMCKPLRSGSLLIGCKLLWRKTPGDKKSDPCIPVWINMHATSDFIDENTEEKEATFKSFAS